MAKVKFGGGVAEIRGSIGGTTFSRNSSGAIMRNKTAPVQPRTASQLAVRALFGLVAALWRGLTDPQRQSFNSQAPSYTRTNVFGDSQPLTGQQLFMKLNNQLKQLGLATISYCSPPISVEAAPAEGLAVYQIGGALTLEGVPATTASDVIAIYASPPLSGGKSFVGTEMRLLQIKPISTISGNLTLTTRYTAVFGVSDGNGILVGDQIVIQTVRVDVNSGQSSVISEVRGIQGV